MRVDLLAEDVLERGVIDLADRVLGGEPHVELLGERVRDAGARERADRALGVVLALDDARTLEVVHQDGLARAVVGGAIDQLDAARARNLQLDVAIHVAIGVATDHDRLLPRAHHRRHVLHDDGLAEDRAVEDRADRAVGARPRLLEVILLHPRRVGRDGRALHADLVSLDRLRRLHRDRVVGPVALGQEQIVGLELQIDERLEQALLHHAPDDARHLVAIHLDDRVLRDDSLSHSLPPPAPAGGCGA